jgi:diacylglycerol kinase family enzyme
MYKAGRLPTLVVFPSIFKGEHVKHTKTVAAIEGKEITVRFTEPKSLQVDGETILNVTEYTVKA